MNQEIKIKLLREIENFAKKKVLVLGDSIVDEFVYGKNLGESLSSPRAIKIQHTQTKFFKGGAGNVVENLLELGASVSLITVLGDDFLASHYIEWVHPRLKLNAFVEKDRTTNVKSRYNDEKTRLLSVERLDCKEISKETEDKIVKVVESELIDSDVIIFQDQGHGFFSQSLIKRLRYLVKETNKGVLINSQTYLKRPNHVNYKGLGTIFMNLNEATALDEGFEVDGNAKTLRNLLDSKICLTLGEKGAILFDGDERHYSDSMSVTAVDTCGAGDSFISAFSVSDFRSNPSLSLKLASIWAGLSVQKSGTEIPNLDELKDYIGNRDIGEVSNA